MSYFLPLHKKVKQIIFNRFLLLAAVAAAFVLLCAISFGRCDLLERILVGALSGVLYVLVFLKSGIIRLLRDKTWEGVIEGKRVKHAANNTFNPRDTRERLICIWSIRRDDGTLVKVKLDTDDVSDGYFRVGDRVLHTRCTKYPTKKVILDKGFLCPVCGHTTIRPRCPYCHTDYGAVIDTGDESE